MFTLCFSISRATSSYLKRSSLFSLSTAILCSSRFASQTSTDCLGCHSTTSRREGAPTPDWNGQNRHKAKRKHAAVDAFSVPLFRHCVSPASRNMSPFLHRCSFCNDGQQNLELNSPEPGTRRHRLDTRRHPSVSPSPLIVVSSSIQLLDPRPHAEPDQLSERYIPT